MEIQLRGVLLAVGVIILIVVAYDMFKRKSLNMESSLHEDEPEVKLPRVGLGMSMEESHDNDLELYVRRTMPETEDHLEIFDPVVEQQPVLEETTLAVDEDISSPHLITITILSRDKYGFSGADLMHALEAAEMRFGKHGLFHRYNDDEIIFSVVNAVEPGYFILETLAQEHVSGITFILLPDQVADPEMAFDKLLRAAKQIAFALNGELLDHERKPLTLAKIAEYQKELTLETI